MSTINKFNLTKLVISIGLTLAVGFLSSYFTTSSISNWYSTLNRPFFAPPNWLFAPVWTSLYIMMGISAFLIWKNRLSKINVKTALIFYLGQLLLNFGWSLIFFSLQMPLLAFIEIILLIIMVILVIKKFLKINKVAGYLLLPYLAWISFASILNFAFWWLNR
jgi:translocator protein